MINTLPMPQEIQMSSKLKVKYQRTPNLFTQKKMLLKITYIVFKPLMEKHLLSVLAQTQKENWLSCNSVVTVKAGTSWSNLPLWSQRLTRRPSSSLDSLKSGSWVGLLNFLKITTTEIQFTFSRNISQERDGSTLSTHTSNLVSLPLESTTILWNSQIPTLALSRVLTT